MKNGWDENEEERNRKEVDALGFDDKDKADKDESVEHAKNDSKSTKNKCTYIEMKKDGNREEAQDVKATILNLML